MANHQGAHFSICSLRLSPPAEDLSWASAARLPLGDALGLPSGSTCSLELRRGANHFFWGKQSGGKKVNPRDRGQNPAESNDERRTKTPRCGKGRDRKPGLWIAGARLAGVRAACYESCPLSEPRPHPSSYLVGTCRGCGCTLWW